MRALEQLLHQRQNEKEETPQDVRMCHTQQQAGSIPAARTSGRCDQVVPVEGQPPKWRDGLRKVRLVMDIK